MVARSKNYFRVFHCVFSGFIDFFRFLARSFEKLLLSFGQTGFVADPKNQLFDFSFYLLNPAASAASPSATLPSFFARSASLRALPEPTSNDD
jgi:hypothetical protein